MSTITEPCDGCGEAIPLADVVELRTLRPSDPHDLCCVMAGCEPCFGQRQSVENHWDSIPSRMTADDFERWVELHGHRHGVWWLT